jgi:hypothetical protein
MISRQLPQPKSYNWIDFSGYPTNSLLKNPVFLVLGS